MSIILFQAISMVAMTDNFLDRTITVLESPAPPLTRTSLYPLLSNHPNHSVQSGLIVPVDSYRTRYATNNIVVRKKLIADAACGAL